MEATLFPLNLDVNVVGAPVLDFTRTMIWVIRDTQSLSCDKNILLDKLEILADAFYVDAKKIKSIITIKSKSSFKPVFQVTTSCKGSDIRI